MSMFGWLPALTLTERRVFNACFGGWALDAMNVQIYSFVIPALIATWGLTMGQAGVLGTAALLVSALGGWFAGWFADRFGRVLTLQIAILWFAAFTFLWAWRKPIRSFSPRGRCLDSGSAASGPRARCCWAR